MKSLLTTKEAAELVGTSRYTINRLRAENDFPIPIRLRGSLRFRRDEIERWLANRPRVNERPRTQKQPA